MRALGARLSIVALLALCLGESGCSEFNVKRLSIGATPVLATRADIRIITERPDPYPTSGSPTRNLVCAEPSPDVALALSRALTAEAHAKTPAGVEAGGSGGYQTSQAALALAGRTSAVVALRDGLFRACEAYANGIIGRDSYALILSQYGDLLVTLILGDSAATNDGGGYSITSERIVTPGDAPSGVPTAPTPAKPAVPAVPPTPAAPAAPAPPAAPAAAPNAAVYRPSGPGGVVTAGPIVLASVVSQPTAGAPAQAPKAPRKPVGKPAPKPAKPAKTKPAKPASPATPPKPDTASIVESKVASPAEGIARAYFGGERDRLVKAMFVVCAAEADRRREGGKVFPEQPPATGDYFDRMCTMNLALLQGLAPPTTTPKP